MKEIRNYHSKNGHHGYQEWYRYDKISHRGNWRNDCIIGYAEWHGFNETICYIR
jgi:hypothetical protein